MQQGQYHKEGVRQYIYLPVCNYENNYSNQLLQFHSVPGLMSYEIRTLNNKNYIYYKLKYKTSLKAVGDYIRLQETTVLNMIDSIVNIIQNTKDYLLDINHIIWSFDYIFVDVESGKLEFCYYPEKLSDNSLADFLSELISFIGRKNKSVVMPLLQFFDYITDPQTDVAFTEFQNKILKKEENTEKDDWEDYKEEMEVDKPLQEKKKHNLPDIGIVILAVANVTVLSLFLFQILPYKYFPLMIILLVSFIVAVIITSFITKEDTPDKIMEEYFNEVEENKKLSVKEENSNAYYGETSILIKDNPDEREQIVIENMPKELFLVPANERDYREINIEEGSIVVGCMQESCDYIIKEKGISRLHAKFVKKEGMLYLIDLHSTNGTFLNGESIEGGKEYLLEEGDAISFFQTVFYVTSRRDEK